jgi:hypothetical protein
MSGDAIWLILLTCSTVRFTLSLGPVFGLRIGSSGFVGAVESAKGRFFAYGAAFFTPEGIRPDST